jgi:hypothetical protein
MSGDTPQPKPRRATTWPDVSMAAVAAVLILGVGALVLVCLGRW